MTGPKTFKVKIAEAQKDREKREQEAAASKRYRARKREGYVRTGPVDVLPELVWTMVELGVLEASHVTQDGVHLRVELEIMAGAWRRFQGMLADRGGDLVDFIKDRSSNEETLRWDDTTFLLEIGLPRSAPGMRADSFLKAIEKAGYEVITRKKSLSDQ